MKVFRGYVQIWLKLPSQYRYFGGRPPATLWWTSCPRLSSIQATTSSSTKDTKTYQAQSSVKSGLTTTSTAQQTDLPQNIQTQTDEMLPSQDGYASSQVSNSPVPEPPPPPGSMQQMQPNVVPPALRSISFSDTNYQRLYCNCSCNVANSNYATLTRQDTNSHYHSSIHQNGSYATGYSGYDGRNRLTDEEDSACPALLEREFHSLHRNVPALRRAGVDTNAIRQHFYPDGGWGWIICGVAFLAHVLTSGLQLSYGLLMLYAMKHLGMEVATETGWLGAVSWSVSLVSSPIIIALCRRKSTRLTAVLGGLVLALGMLFASFATQFNQVAFSYGIVLGVGSSMVRESSTVMLGHYFKRRRQFVEMITMSGEGVGIALFSVILKEGVGKMGWRLGLQAITGFISFSFFMGLLYRPASLYHPQRRAIQHLKNQRKKVKEKKTHVRTPKPPFIDFTPLKSSTVRMLIITSSISAFGIYSPIFFMSLHGYQEDYDVQDLVLLQTFLGLSIALGIVSGGSIINKTCRLGYKDINISTQYVCQISIVITSLSTLILSAVFGFRNLCILSWTYGIGLGGFRYTLKMLALERVRTKYFTKAWGFIKGAESIPVLIGVPLTAFLNDSSSAKYGRAGYYISSAAAAIAAILMFFIGYPSGGRQNVSKFSGNGSITSHCTAMTSDCPDLLNRSYSNMGRCGHWYSPYTALSNGGVCGTLSHHQQTHLHPHHHPHTLAHHHQHRLLHQSPYANHFRHNLLNGTTGGGGLVANAGAGSVSGSAQVPTVGCYVGAQCSYGDAVESNPLGVGFGAGLIGGSVGRQQGRRLQKSLSFAFPPRETYVRGDCSQPYASNRCYSRCETPTHSIPQTIYHTMQPSRSRSVPEGLSYTSQYCTCPWNQAITQPSSYNDTYNRYHRSTASMARPIQVVEQMTTSV
ncbi:unnamed protein product [Hermetia illucens]|uniref:Monocarboxylate transporter n=1 Tax=Hermetia illucens TaxID=343691 RepID=A0A7R8UFS5_HERIL|nr:unnamed protein product [Hermetia illucens]